MVRNVLQAREDSRRRFKYVEERWIVRQIEDAPQERIYSRTVGSGQQRRSELYT